MAVLPAPEMKHMLARLEGHLVQIAAVVAAAAAAVSENARCRKRKNAVQFEAPVAKRRNQDRDKGLVDLPSSKPGSPAGRFTMALSIRLATPSPPIQTEGYSLGQQRYLDST